LILESNNILKIGKNPTATAKYAVHVKGFSNGKVLAPQDGLSQQEKEKIKEAVKQLDQKIQILV
jgi:dihydrodipicolinate synthase/N-acetylneuraminate lyase